jgi:hypothetical protein
VGVALPSGSVTFLLTDIEGSTPLSARANLGDDAFDAEAAAGRALELPELLLIADEVFDEAMRTA